MEYPIYDYKNQAWTVEGINGRINNKQPERAEGGEMKSEKYWDKENKIKDDWEGILRATAQAAIEASLALNRMPELNKYIFTVRTSVCGIDLQIDRNHQVTIFNPNKI